MAKTCEPKDAAAPAQEREDMTDDEMREKVRELQLQKKNSVQIAIKLGLTLKQVNEHWDHEIANENAHEEEEAQ